MSSVLFDNPGPRAIARNRIIGAVVVLVIAAFLAFVIWRFAESGQFSASKWRAFGYPLVWQSIGLRSARHSPPSRPPESPVSSSVSSWRSAASRTAAG